MPASPPPPPPGVPPNPDPWLPARPVPVVRPGTPVAVVRLGGSSPEVLDNVACVSVRKRQGTDPGYATFRYKFTGNDPAAPQSFEQALDTRFTGASFPKLVNIEDRLGVVASRWDGTPYYLFDGNVLDFRGTIAGDTEVVEFSAIGVARALWDTPVGGMYLRDASQPMADVGLDTDLVAQFNPKVRGKSQGNATPVGADHAGGSASYPVFLDPLTANGSAVPPRTWTLPMAAKYLIFKHNPDETFVQNPDPAELDDLLVGREPIDGTPFDPTNSETYTKRELACPNTIITGRDMPTVLHQLVRDKGFGMTFKLDTVGGRPQTTLSLYILQAGTIKDLYLQPRGYSLDPSYSNLGAAQIGRDLGQVVNRWVVDGAPLRYEASFVLAPMFPMATADGATAAAIQSFDKADPSYRGANSDSYRLYGADETGDGHYAVGTGTELTKAADLRAVLGKDAAGRRRVPRADLITVDQHGVPFKARLDYSLTYKGDPGVWDGTGTDWKPVTGGWKLCDDRLGIRVTIDNPNHWFIGNDRDTKSPVVLKGVEAQCQVQTDTTKPNPNFKLRLTCVIEGDFALEGVADFRDVSPLASVIERRVDARDHYFLETVSVSSANNTTGEDEVERDDTDLATSEAIALRTVSESGILEGVVTIPYVTDYFDIGDRLRQIYGRGLGFRTDAGGSSDTPVYPVVDAIVWSFDADRQTTQLHLSDEATERHTVERKLRR